MKRRWFEIMAVSAAVVLQTPASAVEVDGVAATVGSQPILRSDVIHEMRRTNAPAEAFEDVRNALIERKLMLKAAGESKMTLQEWVVDNRVREIIEKGFDGDRNKLVAIFGGVRIHEIDGYFVFEAQKRDTRYANRRGKS